MAAAAVTVSYLSQPQPPLHCHYVFVIYLLCDVIVTQCTKLVLLLVPLLMRVPAARPGQTHPLVYMQGLAMMLILWAMTRGTDV